MRKVMCDACDIACRYLLYLLDSIDAVDMATDGAEMINVSECGYMSTATCCMCHKHGYDMF